MDILEFSLQLAIDYDLSASIDSERDISLYILTVYDNDFGLTQTKGLSVEL